MGTSNHRDRVHGDWYSMGNLSIAAFIMCKTNKEPRAEHGKHGIKFYFEDADGAIQWLMNFQLPSEVIGMQALLDAQQRIRRGLNDAFGDLPPAFVHVRIRQVPAASSPV